MTNTKSTLDPSELLELPLLRNERKINDKKSFNNSKISSKELITNFKDESKISQNKFKKMSSKSKSVETSVSSATTFPCVSLLGDLV